MTDWKLFDAYSLRARLQPALLAVLPAALAIFAWIGPSARWLASLWTIFGTAGGTYLLAVIARNRGRQLEPALWQSWGGAPTTQLLRHRGPANPVLRQRWHDYFSILLGLVCPTAQQEATNPGKADEFYAAGTRILIDKTPHQNVNSLASNAN